MTWAPGPSAEMSKMLALAPHTVLKIQPMSILSGTDRPASGRTPTTSATTLSSKPSANRKVMQTGAPTPASENGASTMNRRETIKETTHAGLADKGMILQSTGIFSVTPLKTFGMVVETTRALINARLSALLHSLSLSTKT